MLIPKVSMPKVGQRVAVVLRSSGKDKSELTKSKDIEVRVITGIYMEPGHIRDHVGERWEVVPNDEKSQSIAEWKTVR